MFDHIGFSVQRRRRQPRNFYVAALAPLGIGVAAEFGEHIGIGRDGRAAILVQRRRRAGGPHASRLHRQKPRRSARFP